MTMATYKSKQLLPQRGKLHLTVFVHDGSNHRSYQEGLSNGIPTKDFETMFDDALLHAIYKHFARYDNPIHKKDYNTVISENLKDFYVTSWFVEYFSENNIYSYKVETDRRRKKGTRRNTVIRRKGKIKYQKPLTAITPQTIAEQTSEFPKRV